MVSGSSSMTGGNTPGLERSLAPLRAQLAQGAYRAVQDGCAQLEGRWPDEPALIRLQGKAADGLGDLPAALALARRAVAVRPRNVRARLRLVRCLWRNGEPAEALAEAEAIARTAGSRPGALLRVAEFFAAVGQHAAAYRCRREALALRPGDSQVLGALAESAAALGRRDEAEQYYDQALFEDPQQVQLLEQRSRLPGRVPTERHAAELGYALDALARDDHRRAPICYALARELEGLGHHEPAFGIWSEGARCRLLALDEATERDRLIMDAVIERFDEAWLRGPAEPVDDRDLVFVTGLPGSGLGALARQLGGRADLGVVLETGFLADAVTRLAAPAESGLARLEAAAETDPRKLAQAYLGAVRQRVPSRQPVFDLSASHLLFLGLIARAFPNAKLVHLRREPLDHCLELFTTLFTKGHAWSYEPDALARHYSAYHRLVGHWRRHLPDRFVDLDYELLVGDVAKAGERLGALLSPDVKAERPPLMADAAAVAGDTEGSGVGRAAHYVRELAPLARRLREDGVPVT